MKLRKLKSIDEASDRDMLNYNILYDILMTNKLLHIELLEFLRVKSNHFGYVEIRPFLLKHFPEESDLRERKKMGDFLKFLSSEDYIDVREKRGIWIIQEAGVNVARKDVSAVVKIKPKGVSLLEQNQLNKFSKRGIILNSVLWLSTLALSIYSFFITQSISDLKTKINDLDKENTILQSTNESIKHLIDDSKKELSKEVNSSNNEKK